MRFSIIIPVHNAEDRIEKSLKIIASQTFKDYELICVCDSCKDNSAEICRKYGAKVIEVEFHNDGLSRSAGLDAAKGEWVLFLDDDDWWLHELVLESIDRKISLVGDENIDILCFSFYWNGIGYKEPMGNNGNIFPNVWSKCWKRSFIGNTRFPEVHSISDLKFSEAMFIKGPKVCIWDNLIYFYNYMRPGSITEIDSKKKND